jgi:aspartyl-tRNA(Asn)/glutamyl-tRNA(Gln) amidotransferase subunit A
MPRVGSLALMPATELLERFRTREVSPVEATREVLAAVDAYNGEVNAYCLVDPEGALNQARRSERRYLDGQPLGLMDGITVGVKDIFLTRGWPTLRGSRLVDPAGPWEVDAPVVAALKRNGAVLVGKTTTPELGWKGVTDSPLAGITRNPWNPSLTAGGSSGGSGAMIPLGMGTLALGTDGGGSIRIPSSFCGVVGIKPTYGQVPHWPASPYDTLAHAGPMGRTIRDLALMLTVLSEPDARDWTALPHVERDFRDGLDRGVAGLRVAFSPTLGYAEVDPEVAASVRAAAEAFEALGASVEEADPGFPDPLQLYTTLWYAGAARATDGYGDAELAQMDPGLVRIIKAGRALTAVDYVKTITARRDLGTLMNAFHQRYDLLLTPTLPIAAFEAGRDVPSGWPDERWETWVPFCYPFNLTQQPAVSVPCGFTEAGLPIGLQIVAPKYRDDLALRAAYAYQSAHPLTDRLPPMIAGD